MIFRPTKALLISSLVLLFFAFGSEASALTISPLKTELNLDPGATETVMVSIGNETASEVYVQVSVSPFSPKDKTGSVALVGDATVVSWVTLAQSSLSLRPGELKEVPVVISIPPNATPGGYYAVTLFKGAAANNGGNQVGVSGQVGSLLLINVTGEIKKDLAISGFTSDRGWWWRDQAPNFTMTIANNGNSHQAPDGMIVMSDMFGRAVASTPINPNSGYVLPGSEREFALTWPVQSDTSIIFGSEWSPWLIGPYTVAVKGYYGTDRQALTADAVTVWVMPVRTIGVVIAIIILLFAVKVFIGRLRHQVKLI